MIDPEMKEISASLKSRLPNSNEQILISSQTSRSHSNGILSSLQVSQSKMVELVEDRIQQPVENSSRLHMLQCQSCEAWQQWSQQSQQTMLLIEKKLIQRQKALQKHIKSLNESLKQQSEAYEKLQVEYQKQKSRDKKIIDQSNIMIQELKKLLKFHKINPKVQRTYKSPSNFQIYSVVREEEEDQQLQDGQLQRKLPQDKQIIDLQNSIIKENNLVLSSSESSLASAQVTGEYRQNEGQEVLNGLRKQISTFSKKNFVQTSPTLPQTKGRLQSAEIIQNLKTSKSQYLSTISNNQKQSPVLPTEHQSTSKTIKLNNHYVNVERSRFNGVASECSFVQDTAIKTSNIFYKEPYDQRTTLISHSDGKNRGVRTRNPQNLNITTEVKKCPQQFMDMIHKLQFENDNLKSYNRVLLQKLSNSRPRKY